MATKKIPAAALVPPASVVPTVPTGPEPSVAPVSNSAPNSEPDELSALAAAVGCARSEVWGFRHYEDRTVVVVMTETQCFKREVAR